MQRHVFVRMMGIVISMSLLHCSSRHQPIDSPNTIKIEDAGEPFKKMMYLNREHWRWGMIIKENTLNDTAIVGRVVPIPPKQTGKFWQGECFRDSIPFDYEPYKATRGKLVIEYYSKPY